MKTYWITTLCFSLLILSGCDKGVQPSPAETRNQADATQTQVTDGESDSVGTDATQAAPPQESAIDSTPANDATFFVIDVRSAEEFAGDNVDGSINIPHTEIVEGIKQVTKDKSAKIYFY